MSESRSWPLSWPAGWSRTERPTYSKFKVTLQQALQNVQGALRRFGADTGSEVKGLIISSNYTLGNESPKDGGVAVYFQWEGRDACIAVDRYIKLQDNLQAVFHVLEAERTKMRHGGLNIVRTSFRGYTALPPSSKKPWRDVLGSCASLSDAETAFKAKARKFHPDATGGDHSFMAELNVAIADARQELKR